MRLNSLTLQNFKVVGEEPITINVAPLTLLFGPNSAGKSTILQALVYLREIFLHDNLDPDITELGGDWLDLGGYRNLVYSHDQQKNVFLKVTVSDKEGLEAEFLNLFNDDVLERWISEDFSFAELFGRIETLSFGVQISWSERLEKPYCAKFEIDVDGAPLLTISADPDSRSARISGLNLAHDLISHDEQSEDDLAPVFSRFFEETVNEDKIKFDSLGSLGDVDEERPFLRHRLPELAAIVGTLVGGPTIGAIASVPLLLKLRDELKQRKQQSAQTLIFKIDEILAEAPDSDESATEISIGLYDMDDAIPHGLEFLHCDEEIWQSDVGFYDEKKRFVEYVLSTLIIGSYKTAVSALSRLTYLGPLRQLPDRHFLPKRTPSETRWSSGLAAWEALHHADQKFLSDLNRWLGKTHLNTGYEVQVTKFREVDVAHPLITYLEQQADADQQALVAEMIEELPLKTRVQLKETRTGLEVMPQDVGVGISQLLPVVVASMRRSGGLVAVEQPELHVHPAIQVELGDLFSHYALTNKKTFLLETHSEHLLLRLLRRIRETSEVEENVSIDEPRDRLSKDQLSIVYLESDQHGLKVTNIELDEDGEFVTRWPKGFFKERGEELFG